MAVERLNIPDNIVIVLKHGSYSNTDIPQGFVVDPANSKQLETARDWGKGTVRQFEFGQFETVEPKEIYTKNEGFKLTFLDAAGVSSQGGKLAFWNCIIEKDDIKAVIGIQQDNLLSLIKQSTMVKGTVEGLSLAKRGSTACVCHSDMEEWKVSKADKEKPKTKKTSKWQIGHSYKTLTKHEVYLGNIYKWFDVTTRNEVKTHPNNIYGKISITHYHYKLMDNPLERKIIMDVGYNYKDSPSQIITKQGAKTLLEVFDGLANRVKEVRNNAGGWELNRASHIFDYNSIISSTPSREVGDIVLDSTGYQEGLTNLLKVYLDKLKMMVSDRNVISSSTFEDAFGCTADPNIKPMFSDEDIEFILDNCYDTMHIDFGDGKEHTGRKRNG